MTLSPIEPAPLQRVADALGDRLKLIFPPAQFVHEIMPARLTERVWVDLTRRTPFVGLGWNDIDGSKNEGKLFTGVSKWTVFLVTKNAGSVRARYFGDKQGSGISTLVTAAIAALNGMTIQDIGTVFVRKANNLYAEGWNDDNSAAVGIDLEVTLTLDVGDTIGGFEIGEFLKMGLTWRFEPDAGVQLQDLDVIRTE